MGVDGCKNTNVTKNCFLLLFHSKTEVRRGGGGGVEHFSKYYILLFLPKVPEGRMSKQEIITENDGKLESSYRDKTQLN